MRVLITGANGQVGKELLALVPEGFQAVGYGSEQLDITKHEQVFAVVKDINPALIINAAAYTAVDKAESDTEQAYKVNCDGVRNLALAAAGTGIPVFHISTDYVFAGNKAQPYTEEDLTLPTGVYGASKLAGEQALAAECAQYVILRTSWVFGQHGNNFVKTMLRLAQEREQLGIVADQHGSPTSAASIASALWQLAQQYRAKGGLQWGIYHYSGAPACTWHDFAQEIFRQAYAKGKLQRIPVLQAITTLDYPTPAKRPANSVLECKKLKQLYEISSSDWRDDLGQVIEQLVN